MKTIQHKPLAAFSVAVGALAVMLMSSNAIAGTQTEATGGGQVTYQSRFANHSIFSYPNSVLGKRSLNPKIIFVSQAYGPAIHSYAHAGSELTVPWNVGYIDTAYGPAIYSYEGRESDGEVKILPILVE